jgi:hypothetical protein
MKKVKLFEQYLAEVTVSTISGTSGRTITSLDNRKYELKKDVKGARISDFTNVTLPKGTIITNLPGGVFAKHDDLKQKYCIGYKGERWSEDFGVQIRTMPDTLTAIEKDSKVLESLNEAMISVSNKSINSRKSKIDTSLIDKLVKQIAPVLNTEHSESLTKKRYEDIIMAIAKNISGGSALQDPGLIFERNLNEAKEYSFSFNYNTDEDDVEYVQNILMNAGVDAIAEPGIDSEEMVVKAPNVVELRKAKKAIQTDGFEVNESNIDEATTSWKKMMAGVKTSESGPWSLVAIENKKVVAQKNDIKIQDMIPAHFEAMRKEYPKAAIHIEDGTGMVVWNESLNEALVGDKLTKQFTKETGIAVWDKVSLKSESGIWTVVRLWAPKDDGGMNPGLHIELTKGNSREHFQVMDDNSNLTQFGKEIKKNI